MSQPIAVIGAGNMGSAMIRGLLQKAPKEFSIQAVDMHSDRLQALTALGPVKTSHQPNAETLKCDVITLCVKPYDLPQLATHLRGKIPASTLVISVLAGTTMQEVSDALDFRGAVVRAMPNIAATVGLAATAMCTADETDASKRSLTERIFGCVGDAHWVRESHLDAVTGLSGSGPAYIYMVIEALTDGGVKMGLPRQLALDLSVQTVLGSAMLVKESRLHPAVLRDQVTTPAGTTIHAIDELEAHGLRSMLMKAVATATERSKTLRKR